MRPDALIGPAVGTDYASVASLQRVREIIEVLQPPEILVTCGLDEDHDKLLAQVRGELPIFLH